MTEPGLSPNSVYLQNLHQETSPKEKQTNKKKPLRSLLLASGLNYVVFGFMAQQSLGK